MPESGMYGFPAPRKEPEQARDVQVTGKSGATAGADLGGATTRGAPTSGRWSTGAVVVDQGGPLYVCTAGGTPGTWALVPRDVSAAAGDLIYRARTTAAATLTIGFIGDSITHDTPPSGTLTPPAIAALDASAALAGLTVSANNQGIAGTTSADWTPTSGTGDYTAAKAAFASAGVGIVHVMLGTNDAKTAVATSAATYGANLSAIASDLVASGYTVVLSYPPYVVPTGSWGAGSLTLLVAYQAQIDALVNGAGVCAGDRQAYTYFQAHQSEYYDGVHPTATGAGSLAALWAAVLVPPAALRSSVLRRLPIGTSGQELTVASGLPAWTDQPGASVTVDHAGSAVGTRPTINLIDGANVTLTVADNSGSSRVDVTVAASAGGASSLLVLLPNPYNFIDDSASDNGQPPDFIMTAGGDVIGVGGM